MTTTISPLPTPPTPADSPVDFNTKAFALLGGLPTFVAEANAQAAGLDASVAAAGAQAAIATNKAGEALTSANNAAISKTGADSARDAAVIAKNAAEAALDSFDDRYHGQKPADPANDNDGGALLVGALYFRTTAPIGMKVWTGTAWDDAYANLSSKFDKTGGDVDGNINFTGTGRRITGDFSNGTVASRTLFQTRVVNGATDLTIVPNGTATYAAVSARSSDSANASVAALTVDGAAVTLASHKTGSGAYLPLTFYAGGEERLRIDPTTGNVLATSGALGYGVGSGGTVVQATSKSTTVTLNKPTGRITTHNEALAAGATVTFICFNSYVSATSCVVANCTYVGGGGYPANYQIDTTHIAAGYFYVRIKNLSAVSLSDALVIQFNVHPGAIS